MKVNFTTNKLNKDPINITLSGVGFTQTQNGIGFRKFFQTKLWGTGATINEINVIADGIRDEKVVFVPINGSDARHGYLNGVLIETPTQHIIFKGYFKSLETQKLEEGRTEDTLEEVIEHTQIALSESILARWAKPSFNDWVVGVLEGSDSKNADGERELESHYVNEQIESLSLFYIDGTEEILYYSNA